MKVCKHCQKEKPDDDFPILTMHYESKKWGLRVYKRRDPRCGDCRREYFRKHTKKRKAPINDFNYIF